MRAGVLAIGSLYWSNHTRRVDWRNSRLNQDSVFSVHVPIRYGRKSKRRAYTFTMVFSLLCLRVSHGLGIAKVLPFSREIKSSADLIREVEFLWAAERKKTNIDGTLSASWGCVALLANPDAKLPDQFLDDWTERVSQEKDYGQISHLKSEPEVVSKEGFLQIPWPKTVENKLLPLDLLIATATNPTLRGNPPTYPRIKEVAMAWKRDKLGNASYFHKNRECGIFTYQDRLILRYLDES